MIFITICVRENSRASARTGVSGLHECHEFLTESILFFSVYYFSPCIFYLLYDLPVYCAARD